MIQAEIIESICDELAQLDSKIISVKIIDDGGRILAQNKSDKLNDVISIEESEILFTEIAFGVRMERGYDKHFGKENFVISYGSKIVSATFPLHKEIVCVFVPKDTDTVKMALSISNILSRIRYEKM